MPWEARLIDLRDYNSDYLRELAATPDKLLADLMRIEARFHQIEQDLLEQGMNPDEASEVALERTAAPSTYGREMNPMPEAEFNKLLTMVETKLLPQALKQAD